MGRVDRGSRNKKRKFKGNRYTVAGNVGQSKQNNISEMLDNGETSRTSSFPCISTASSSKLGNITAAVNDSDRQSENFMISTDCLNNILKLLSCPICFSTSISAEIDSVKHGCAVQININCTNCEFSYMNYSSPKVDKFFEMNRRFVYAMRQVGCGHAEACKFTRIMNMPPPPTNNAYNSHVRALAKTTRSVAEEIMLSSANRVRQRGNTNKCGVTVDGTWQRRGYSSLSGVMSVISVDSGEILDVEPMTKLCMGCRKMSNDDKASSEYQNWKVGHNCKANYAGSSPGMEPVGVCRMFQRSLFNRGLMYLEYYGDGDSKSFKSVSDMEPYEGHTIVKKECIGHYQKRLGTALRKLKKENKSLGGKGKLTDAKINKMQNYFGIALRNNTESVDKMSRAIWSTFYHLGSQDNHPLHSKCPPGSQSWCSYQRAKAENTQTLARYKHTGGLPLDIMTKIKPIYESLTSTVMLEKCLHGKTQNNNESFNSLVWQRCPKDTFVGKDNLDLAVYDSVCHFNAGAKPEAEVMRRMYINPGKHMLISIENSDELRLKQCEKNSTPEIKNRRKYLRGMKKKKDDNFAELEGLTYEAGGF